PPTTHIYPLSLHDALPISPCLSSGHFCLELLLDVVALSLNPCYLRRAENGHEVSTEQNLHFDSSGSGSNLSARIPSSTSLNCSVMASLDQSSSLYGTVGFPARPIQ